MVGNKIDQLDDEHDEQPLRQKLEETELPGECLHSEWALNIPRAAAVDKTLSSQCLAIGLCFQHMLWPFGQSGQ